MAADFEASTDQATRERIAERGVLEYHIPLGVDPDALVRASAIVWDSWIDAGRSMELEDPTPQTESEYWADVYSTLRCLAGKE